MEPRYWLNLQSEYDMRIVMRAQKRIDRAAYSSFSCSKHLIAFPCSTLAGYWLYPLAYYAQLQFPRIAEGSKSSRLSPSKTTSS